MAIGTRRIIHVYFIVAMLLATVSPLARMARAQDVTPAPTRPAVEETLATVDPADSVTSTPTAPATPAAVEESPTDPSSPSPTLTETSAASGATTSTPENGVSVDSSPTPTAASGPKTSAISSPSVTLSKTRGVVGANVVVTIGGFPANTLLKIRWDSTDLTSVTTDANGSATKTIKIPIAVAGSHRIAAAMTGRSRSAGFSVVPRVSLKPNSGAAGSVIKAALTGYASLEKVTIYFGPAKLKLVSVSSTGSWSGNLTVPSAAELGAVRVEGSGSAGNTRGTTFTVTDSGTATPTGTPTPTRTPTPSPGALIVNTKDEDGDVLKGACFSVFMSVEGVRGTRLGQACDSDDGADGVTSFGSIPSGAVIVSESKAPSGYLPAPDVPVTVIANQTSTINVENGPNSGLTVVKSNEFGSPLKGSCFSVYTNVGGGSLGSLVKSACDDDDSVDDGLIRFGDLSDGSYVLVEKVVPRGYARAAKQEFSYSAGVPLAVAIQDMPGGAIVVTKVNEAGDPISGACFDAYVDLGGGAVGNFVDRGCNDAGNTITIAGLPVGNYFLIESKAPPGYSVAAKVRFSIAPKKDVALTVADTPTTKLIIRKQDEFSRPLKGSCFEVYKAISTGRGTLVIKSTCDNADGKDDGYLTIPLSPGAYVLAESVAPKGFLIGADVRFRISVGLDTDLDVENVLGGIVKVTTIDKSGMWSSPKGACYTVWSDKSIKTTKLGTACDAYDGKNDGITSVGGLPTGSWFLEQTKAPWGYFESPGFSVNVVAREVTEVGHVNEAWPLLIIHKEDDQGNPLGGACFTAFVDLGGGQRGAEWISPDGPLCDVDEDGDLYALVTPGNQILVEKKSPLGYLPIADKSFVMVRGQVTELTIKNFQVGFIYVHKTNQNGDPLTGACFEAYHNAGGKKGALAATGCDKEVGDGTFNKSLDAITILNGLEPGEFWIVEKTPPKGYFAAPDVLVNVVSAENHVTVKDEAWPMLTITKVDDNGDPVKGACFKLFKITDGVRGAAYGGQACGVLNNVIKIGAEPGTYLLGEVITPAGYVTTKDVKVTFTRGVDKTIEIINYPAGFIEVNNVDEANAPLKGACWELWTDVSGQAVTKVAMKCSTNLPGTPGQVTLEAPPGKYWLKQNIVPFGYKPLADRKVTVVERVTVTLTIQNEPYPRFVVNSVDAGNKPLPGACFDIFVDGDTTLGKKVVTALCDKADGVLDGTTTQRLEPGRYVARETTAPANYAKAPDFKFTILADVDLVLTLQHQVAGVLLVATKDRASLVLTGACFELWTKLPDGKRGVLVAKACDQDVSDSTSKLDGTTKLAALPPGSYLLVQSFAPSGYIKAPDRAVTVTGGQETGLTVTNDKT